VADREVARVHAGQRLERQPDAAGRTFRVSFRDPAALALRIDLADPPPEAP